LVEGCDRVEVLRDGVSVVQLEGEMLTQSQLMRAMAEGQKAL
jgi:ABC-type sugar transport system ATPase subunit